MIIELFNLLYLRLLDAGFNDWCVTLIGTFIIYGLLKGKVAFGKHPFVYIIGFILFGEVFLTIGDRFIIVEWFICDTFMIGPLILIYLILYACFYEDLVATCEVIFNPVHTPSQKIELLKQRVLTKGKLKVKHIINAVSNVVTRRKPIARNMKRFTETDIYALSGVEQNSVEFVDLMGTFRSKYPHWPYIMKSDTRAVKEDLSTWAQYGQLPNLNFNPLVRYWDNIPLSLLMAGLFTTAFLTIIRGYYPSGITVSVLIYSIGIFEGSRRTVSFWLRVCDNLSPTVWFRRLTPSVSSLIPECLLVSNNFLKTLKTRILQSPSGIGFQLKAISQSKSMQEYCEKTWVLASMLGVEHAVINGVLSKMFGGRLNQPNPDLPPIVEEQGPSENKSIIFMLALSAGLLGLSTNAIDAKMMTALGGVAASAAALERCWGNIEDTLCDWGFITTAKYEHVGLMMDKIQNLITNVSIMASRVNTNTSWFLDPNNFDSWTAIKMEVETLRKDVATNKYSALVGTTFPSEVRLLALRVDEISASVDSFVGSCGVRVVPVGVMLEGESQIGKSKMSSAFVRMIKTHILNDMKESPSKYEGVTEMFDVATWAIWDQQCRDDFDVGYCGQKIHRIDDIFTKKDGKDQPALLQFISPARCGTVQAAILDKGKPYVVQLVIGSCNNPPQQSPVITNLDALYNRFPSWCVLSLKQELQEDGTSKSMQPPNGEEHDESFNWLDIRVMQGRDRYASGRNGLESTAITLPDLVKRVAGQLLTNAKVYKQELELEKASWRTVKQVTIPTHPAERVPVVQGLTRWLDGKWEKLFPRVQSALLSRTPTIPSVAEQGGGMSDFPKMPNYPEEEIMRAFREVEWAEDATERAEQKIFIEQEIVRVEKAFADFKKTMKEFTKDPRHRWQAAYMWCQGLYNDIGENPNMNWLYNPVKHVWYDWETYVKIMAASEKTKVQPGPLDKKMAERGAIPKGRDALNKRPEPWRIGDEARAENKRIWDEREKLRREAPTYKPSFNSKIEEYLKKPLRPNRDLNFIGQPDWRARSYTEEELKAGKRVPQWQLGQNYPETMEYAQNMGHGGGRMGQYVAAKQADFMSDCMFNKAVDEYEEKSRPKEDPKKLKQKQVEEDLKNWVAPNKFNDHHKNKRGRHFNHAWDECTDSLALEAQAMGVPVENLGYQRYQAKVNMLDQPWRETQPIKWEDHIKNCMICCKAFKVMPDSRPADPSLILYEAGTIDLSTHLYQLGWMTYGDFAVMRHRNVVWNDITSEWIWEIETIYPEASELEKIHAAQLVATEETFWDMIRPRFTIGDHGIMAKFYNLGASAAGWSPVEYIKNWRHYVKIATTWLKDNKMIAVIIIIIFLIATAIQCYRGKKIVPETEEQVVNEGSRPITDTRVWLVVGGGISSLGKGRVASNLIERLVSGNQRVKAIKLDPYLNNSASEFNPSEHGEAFILPSGKAVDLDIGRYARAGAVVSENSAITGGSLQWLARKSTGEKSLTHDVLGKVLADEIRRESIGFDDVVIELGGTLGDTENIPFTRGLHPILSEFKSYVICMAPVLMVSDTGEYKLRVVKQAISDCRSRLGHPVSCVMVRGMDEVTKMISEVPTVVMPDCEDHEIKERLEPIFKWAEEGGADTRRVPLRAPLLNSTKSLIIVSKYPGKEAHTSIIDSVRKMAEKQRSRLTVRVVTNLKQLTQSKKPDYCVIAGGFGTTNIDELTACTSFLMDSKVRTLGICLGHQLAYRAAFDYNFEELAEPEAKVVRALVPMTGEKSDKNIYRNSYIVIPRGETWETTRTEHGQEFVVKAQWTETMRTVQYHPEFVNSHPDFQWLLNISTEEFVAPTWRHMHGEWNIDDNSRPRNIQVGDHGATNFQSIHSVQTTDRTTFKYWTKNDIVVARNLGYVGHAPLIVIGTPEQARKAGIVEEIGAYGDTLMRKHGSLTLLDPADDTQELRFPMVNRRTYVACLSKTHVAEGLLFRVWRKVKENKRVSSYVIPLQIEGNFVTAGTDLEDGKHTHVCDWCSVQYVHYHKFKHADHPQHEGQCPNIDCPQYHEGDNPTRAKILTEQQSLEFFEKLGWFDKIRKDDTYLEAELVHDEYVTSGDVNLLKMASEPVRAMINHSAIRTAEYQFTSNFTYVDQSLNLTTSGGPVVHFVHDWYNGKILGHAGFARQVRNATVDFDKILFEAKKKLLVKYKRVIDAPACDRLVITTTLSKRKVYNLITNRDNCWDDLKRIDGLLPHTVDVPRLGQGLWEHSRMDFETVLSDMRTNFIVYAPTATEEQVVSRTGINVKDELTAYAEGTLLPDMPSEQVESSDIPSQVSPISGIDHVDEQVLDAQAMGLHNLMQRKHMVGVSAFNPNNPEDPLIGALGGWGIGNRIICPAHLSVQQQVGELYRISKHDPMAAVQRLFNPKAYCLARIVVIKKEWDLMALELLTSAEAKLLRTAKTPGMMYGEAFPMDIIKHFPHESMLRDRKIKSKAIFYAPLTGICTLVEALPMFNYSVSVMGKGVKTFDLVKSSSLSFGPAGITQNGDCGGYVLLCDPQLSKKLIAMHTLANHDFLFGQITTLERITTLLDLTTEQGPLTYDIRWAREDEGSMQWRFIDRDPSKCEIVLDGEYKTMLGVTKFETGSIPKSTNRIQRAVFYGAFETDMIPCCLRATDPRIKPEALKNLLLTESGKPSIIKTQVSQYTTELNENLDAEVVEKVFRDLTAYTAQVLREQGIPINAPKDMDVAIAEAINGNSLIPGFDRLDVHAGPGSLWQAAGVSEKSHFFFVPEDEVTPTGQIRPNSAARQWFKNTPMAKALYKQVKVSLENARKGLATLSITADKLKVETKKRAHIEIGKSRSYSDVPIDFLLVKRALFGRLKAAVVASGTLLMHGVSTNPHSTDWSKLGQWMTKFGNVYDADYTNYDRRTLKVILERLYAMYGDLISQLHPDDDWRLARETIGWATINSISSVDGNVWMAQRGTKSGDVLTTIDNNFVNVFNMLYAWRKATKGDLWHFMKYVRVLVFGDDLLWSVSDEYKDIFNFDVIQKAMAELGHILTPASKDGKEQSGNISDVQFLKRGFITTDAGIWFAPLNKNSIWAPFSWSQVPDWDIQGWVNTVNMSLQESLLHGKSYYDASVRKLSFKLEEIREQYPALCRHIRPLLSRSYEGAYQEYLGVYGLVNKNNPRV